MTLSRFNASLYVKSAARLQGGVCGWNGFKSDGWDMNTWMRSFLYSQFMGRYIGLLEVEHDH